MPLQAAVTHLESALSEIHSALSDHEEEIQVRLMIFEAWVETLIERVGDTAKEVEKVPA